jgi:hypothetical protein
MSDQEVQQLVNNELTERVNNAYYADDCSLFDWMGIPHLVIRGSKEDEASSDIIIPYNDLKSMVEKLYSQAEEISKSEKEKLEDEKW